MNEENLESNVVAYQNSFPTIFQCGHNAILSATDGKEYIDFFAGAGALNFGHNQPETKEKVIEYLKNDLNKWLKELRKICDEFGIMMIIDDIQVGVWRTGTFFSFEEAEIVPDIVIISKSIGGIGMPLSLVFFNEALDVFNPEEHTGTFRGNQLGFIAGQAAIEYAYENNLAEQTKENEQVIQKVLEKKLPEIDNRISFRGKGMIWGIDFLAISESLAEKVQKECFNQHLIIECAGSKDAVLKLLPPLTIEKENLSRGLEIIIQAIYTVLNK